MPMMEVSAGGRTAGRMRAAQGGPAPGASRAVGSSREHHDVMTL